MAVNDDYVGMDVGPVGIIGMDVGPVGKTVTGAQLAGGTFGDISVKENPGNAENDLLAVVYVSHFTTFEVLVQNLESKTCEPDCADKSCGDDGCGASCGECNEGMFCNPAQQCSSSQGDLLCDEAGDDFELQASQESPFVINTNVKEVEVPSDSDSLSICPAGDSDWFSLTLTTAKAITVKMTTDYPELMGWNLIRLNTEGTLEPKFTNAITEKSVSFTTETLDVGEYIVEIKARLDASSKTVPAYSLLFSMNEFCVPQCNGKICGPDGCGGQCGICTDGKQCKAGQCATECGSGQSCDDGNECTQDSCDGSICISNPHPDSQPCNQGVCFGGQCQTNNICDPGGATVYCDSSQNTKSFTAPVNSVGELLFAIEPNTGASGTLDLFFKLPNTNVAENVPWVVQTVLPNAQCGP
ncbi:MAG TPA: hypothetical protein EYN66_04705, partial [Myxococcales bacterium]|nr:hypothetical protein [Myxococcales bacterium]